LVLGDCFDVEVMRPRRKHAWQSLFDHAALKAGQSILVNGAGAGGAVGGYAVQLAKQAGAVVTATAGPRSADRVRAYGADRVVGHLGYSVEPDSAPFDVVLNLVTTTPDETAALVCLVGDGGVFVSVTTPAAEDSGVRLNDLPEVHRDADAGQLAGKTVLIPA
jgi:NADPH:quinone reductase-like Zn-dependent oxidoreductase